MMETFIVKTGFGFFKDAAGHIVSKAQLPPGSHPIRPGFTFTEVNSQAELDALEVYQAPPTADEINEKKIADKIRQTAIDALKAEGQLPANFEG